MVGEKKIIQNEDNFENIEIEEGVKQMMMRTKNNLLNMMYKG